MKIKEINDIYKINIICTNTNEVMECKEILEKLGLKTLEFDNKKDSIIVRKIYDGNGFTNSCNINTDFDNISFYDFKKQTKNLIPVVQDIEYNEEDGRITKINNCKGQSVFIVGVGKTILLDELIKSPCLVKFYEKNIELGKVYINEEMFKKAENKTIIENKLRNIASRLNNGIKLDRNEYEQKKYYIGYNWKCKDLFYDWVYRYQIQGTIYCLSDKFLEEAKKEIGEDKLKQYFKE